MNNPTLWLVLLLMTTLVATLAWVGLRFFCPSNGPAPRVNPEARVLKRPPPKPRQPRQPSSFRLSSLLAPFKSKQMIWVGVGLLLAALTVTVTLALSNYINPPAITGEDMGPTGSVGAILHEEILVPPQPLPPSMFIGTGSFDLEHADRDWSKLDAHFRNTVLQLFAKMEGRGYKMALLEGYRSAERQEMLAAKGPSVTQARGGQSKHQYGLAADIAPLHEDRLVISDRDPWAAAAYQVLGEEAEKLGLTWGGKWAMRDLGHVESAAKVSRLMQSPAS
jgi:peptidoglycan LD-endopeptidase CwlK